MEDPRRRSTLSFTFILCFSLWLTPGETSTFLECPAKYFTSTSDVRCSDRCEQRGSDYYWCHSQDGWDYCSPLQDHTYKNEPCRFNHECGSYGESYTWCYTTSNNDWDYCGVIGRGECVFSQTYRAKRQTNNPVICIMVDNNGRVTVFREGDSRNIAKPSNKEHSEALDLINRWNNQRLRNQARSNLIRSDRVRLDNQGSFTRNNQLYYNLQIQLNGPRASGRSTTVAHIIVPDDTSAEYMRLAFRESLELQVSVKLEVEEASTSTNNNQKRCQQRKY